MVCIAISNFGNLFLNQKVIAHVEGREFAISTNFVEFLFIPIFELINGKSNFQTLIVARIELADFQSILTVKWAFLRQNHIILR